MTTRRAACSCGQLHLAIEGEPSRISMCHCLECQRRTGAVISNQARFRREQVTFAGQAAVWQRKAESGNALTFHFCPTCGSTVYWEGEGFPGYVAVAIGNFADHCGVGRITPPLGCLASRYAGKARSKAGLSKRPMRPGQLGDNALSRDLYSTLSHARANGRDGGNTGRAASLHGRCVQRLR
jgi:hypothetical protein